MASPFTIFRKYRSTLLAVFGVLLMISFTVFGVIPNLQDMRSEAGQNAVVVSSAFGDLHEADIYHLRQQRSLAVSFLTRVRLHRTPPQFVQFIERQVAESVVAEMGGFSEESLVEDWLLVKEADRHGLVVSDVNVTAYLEQITQKQVTAAEFGQILRSLQASLNTRPSRAALYEALRHTLTARQMRMMAIGLLQPSPVERFEGYERLRQRAAVELIPIDTKDFKAQVPDPKDSELKVLFDQHKQQEPTPGSPDPGFKVPAKASFQYVQAVYEKFVRPDEITPDEIQQHYDKFKDERYQFSGLGPDPEPAPPVKAEDKPAETKSPETKKPEGTKPEEKKSEEKKPEEKKPEPKQEPLKTEPAKTETKSPEKKEPAKTEPPKTEPAKTEPEKKAEEKKVEEKKPDEKKSDDKSSSLLPRRILSSELSDMILALAEDAQKEAEKKTSEPAKTDATSTTKTEPAKTEPTKDSTPAETPAKTTDSTSTPAATTPATSTPAASTPAAEKKPEAPLPLADLYKLPENIRDGASPKHDPLWKVEKDIREQLAREKATKRMDDLLNDVENSLREYSQQLFTWESDQRAKTGKQPTGEGMPPAPDLEARAKQVCEQHGFPGGLVAGKSGLVSAYEASRLTGIGESSTQGGEGRPFGQMVGQSMRVFTLGSSTDTAGNRYRFLKTTEQKTHVPSFEEAKSEVLNAWKTIEARKLVQKRADELAAEARKQQKSLKELFGNDKNLTILEPLPFTWLTRGTAAAVNQRAQLRLSEVEGVVDAGDEFMRGVFKLEDDGSVGTTINNPKTIAYVVRIKSFSPPLAVLREGFLSDPAEDSFAALENDRRRIFVEWFDAIKKQAKLQWKRDPQQDAF